MGDGVRVMVVDDSASTRAMLREALSLGDGIEVVGEAGNGREAVELVEELAPDVVLMDVRMPDGDGVAAARTITARFPRTQVVALTWSDDAATVREMLAAGAIGYVVKGGTIDELCTAILRAAEGEPELDQKVLPAAVDDLRRLLEEERERRAQVERLARTRQEFVQVLSHELRTPLTVIAGVLRMLERQGVGPDEAPLLESAIRRADELEFLVEGLELAVAGPTLQGDADPARAVRDALARLGSRTRRRQAEVRLDLEEAPWPGVPQRSLERVAYELVANAVSHGVPPVEVSARREGEAGVLTVTDRGGWSPCDWDFDAFSQGDMSATRTAGGMGVGLFVASRLCASCEGALSIRAVEGRTVAQARFPLRLPRASLNGPRR
ncbi:MAG TPA: response regulator [Actinomycetota bacterium]|nr:response regulator [Actinomycetota bacterium]